jgi:hypothetical protein
MRHVKTAIFLLLCLGIGLGVGKGLVKFISYLRSRHPVDSDSYSHTGVGDPPPLHGFYLPLNDSASSVLTGFGQLHASAVALSYPDTTTASGALLTATVTRAHTLGLKVLLLPPPVFSLQNPYPAPLPAIAAQAQAANVDLLCLSWIDGDADPVYWRSQSALVRNIFRGKLLLAATADFLPRLEFDDCADYLAAIGPIPLPARLPCDPSDVDLHALRVAWTCRLDSLESLARKADRRLILLNMAVPITISANLSPPGEPAPPTPNPPLQLLATEALLYETKGRNNTEGLFLAISPDPAANPNILPKIEDLWSKSSSPPPAAAPVSDADPDDPT